MENSLLAILGVLATALGGLLYKLLDSYRSKQKIKDEHTQSVSTSAKLNVDTASSVVNMLQEMLKEERSHFDNEISRAKDSCTDLIAELKKEYDEKLDQMKSENEALSIRVGNLDRDNTALTKQIVVLTESNVETIAKFEEVRGRLSKYESVTTDDLNEVVKKNRINKKL